nr:hypothetical protein [Pseudarthrobacter sp. fls2-241-R2A-127]
MASLGISRSKVQAKMALISGLDRDPMARLRAPTPSTMHTSDKTKLRINPIASVSDGSRNLPDLLIEAVATPEIPVAIGIHAKRNNIEDITWVSGLLERTAAIALMTIPTKDPAANTNEVADRRDWRSLSRA